MKKKILIYHGAGRIAVVLCTVLLLSLLCPQNAFAVGAQVVRLGYYERPGFQEGSGDGERKSGYAYDYLQKISDYTGWNYEYIYGDQDTLKEMMSRGEVDLIAGFSHSDNIPSQAEFAEKPFGTETCYIYKRVGDDSIKSGYIVGLIGKKIGVVEGTQASKYLDQFIADQAFSCRVMLYSSENELFQALRNGEIDAFAMNDMNVGNVSEVVPLYQHWQG